VRVAEFDFDLPADLIAQQPAPRGESRLLVLTRETGALQHAVMSDLPALLRPGDLLVVNDTRVFAARLLGHREPSGGVVECMLLGPQKIDDEPASAAPLARAATAGTPVRSAIYDALVHPGQKLRPGALMRFEGPPGVLMAEVLRRHFHGRRTIRLWSPAGGDVDSLIDALGHTPLPPYIKRPDTRADRERYQTVFARARGSVAAPTAGLHFTPELLDQLAARGVPRVAVTLHVGYGTFKPVRAEIAEDHVVDPEPYEISGPAAEAIERARGEGRRVIAVGTTTTRALESTALSNGGRVVATRALASTFIHPGFRFQVIGGLVTNFHLPRSSLLMLVSAFATREPILAAYREAIAQRYRFYSYGDAMLIL
jgi:S-adenosylmethionine:tRNA ribosyltransferase-isomerase